MVRLPHAPAVKTAKLEDKLSSDPATTTVIEKTPATDERADEPANEMYDGID